MDHEFDMQQPNGGEITPPMEPQPEIAAEVTPEEIADTPVFQDTPRFDPSGVPRWEPAEDAGKSPKVKKPKYHSGAGRKVLKTVVSLLLVFLLSVGGGYIGANLEYWLYSGNGNLSANNPAGQNPDGNSGTLGGQTVDVLTGKREDNTIKIHEIETGKLLTAAQVYAKNVQATVGITTSTTTNYWGYPTTSAASGSGFVYSANGYIVTNYHVVEGSNSITVSTYDGRSLDAKIVNYDESYDIAVLKVEATDLVPVITGDSDNLNVGDPVVAIGNPLGELTFSLTSGSVSALEREVTFSGGNMMDLIQTDCAINSGNSGGALFNLYGEVIGVTNAKYSGNSASGASIDNIGFAIPMNSVKNIINSIIEKGYVIKPYIGVTVVDVSQDAQDYYGLPKGASVRSVVKDSPAEESGLKANDIITHINGEEITGSADLKRFIIKSAPGTELKLTVWRQSKIMEITVTIGEDIQNNQ